MIMPSLDYHAMPIDIPSMALVDPSSTPITTTAFTQNLPGYPSSFSSSHSHSPSNSSSSSSLASSRGDSTPWTLWSNKVHSGVPDTMGQGSYYPNVWGQECRNSYSSGYPPDGLGTSRGSLATPPCVNAKAPTTEAMDVIQGQYNAIHLGGMLHHPVLRRHRYEQTGDQIGDRRFTCTFNNCGKSFSGEWEKARHIKSIHGPPTIGCRACNYKQSRKDLFSEHCRKRHPGESIEGLMVQLVHGVSP